MRGLGPKPYSPHLEILRSRPPNPPRSGDESIRSDRAFVGRRACGADSILQVGEMRAGLARRHSSINREGRMGPGACRDSVLASPDPLAVLAALSRRERAKPLRFVRLKTPTNRGTEEPRNCLSPVPRRTFAKTEPRRRPRPRRRRLRRWMRRLFSRSCRKSCRRRIRRRRGGRASACSGR
jgi:hypothetical protein